VNSFRFIRDAIEYEIDRQIEAIEAGERIQQETRLYNAHEGRTYSMRSKEQAHRLPFFSRTDLLPLVVDAHWQESIRRSPEIAGSASEAHGRDYGLPNTTREFSQSQSRCQSV